MQDTGSSNRLFGLDELEPVNFLLFAASAFLPIEVTSSVGCLTGQSFCIQVGAIGGPHLGAFVPCMLFNGLVCLSRDCNQIRFRRILGRLLHKLEAPVNSNLARVLRCHLVNLGTHIPFLVVHDELSSPKFTMVAASKILRSGYRLGRRRFLVFQNDDFFRR